MTGIQIILVAGVIVLVFYYTFRLKNAFIDLVIVFGFTFFSCFFILFPSYTNAIAHKLGVGRGADLLFYLAILFFLFVTLKIFSRLKRMEQQITEIVRRQAIKEASLFNDSKK